VLRIYTFTAEGGKQAGVRAVIVPATVRSRKTDAMEMKGKKKRKKKAAKLWLI
jgi:hypothetical protein